MKRNILFCALFIGLVVAVFGQIDTTPAFEGLREGNGTITITKYNGRMKDVIIPEKVKISEKEELPVGSIGYNAFSDKELISVTIPNGVTSIGKMAFNKNKLTSVIIGNRVTSIESYAFYNNKLTSITIGANVSIDSFAFQGAFRSFYNRGGKKAGTYVLRAGTYVLQESEPPEIAGEVSNFVKIVSAFDGVKETNGTITITGYKAWGRRWMKDVIIPEKITEKEEELTVRAIGNSAFNAEQLSSREKLTSFIIPEGVTSIGEKAFANNKVTSVTIPNSVTSIGKYAFENNQLTSITIGANVSIDSWAFGGNFINNYNKGGKKAGTYVLRMGRYVLQE
jgi:hypothetical protein